MSLPVENCKCWPSERVHWIFKMIYIWFICWWIFIFWRETLNKPKVCQLQNRGFTLRKNQLCLCCSVSISYNAQYNSHLHNAFPSPKPYHNCMDNPYLNCSLILKPSFNHQTALWRTEDIIICCCTECGCVAGEAGAIDLTRDSLILFYHRQPRWSFPDRIKPIELLVLSYRGKVTE